MAEPFDSYKKLRNQIAELDFEGSFAAAWAFSQYTQVKNFRFPDDVEKHASFSSTGYVQPFPWQLETIMREVVLHAADASRRDKSLKRWNTMSSIINSLRRLEDVIHEPILGPDNVLLELLRISHQQFPWQRNPTTRMVGRYYWIFKDAKIDEICRKLTGLSIDKIYAMGLGLWGLLTSKAFFPLPMQVDASIAITREEFESFFALCSTEVYEFRQIIKAGQRLDDTYAYDNRFLRASPLIRFRKAGRDFMACPLPTLLYWRFTSGLYYDLTAEPDFFNALGASFQGYVGEVFRRALEGKNLKCQAEEKYGPKGKPKDTVDWIILDSDAALFLECKSKRLSLSAKTNLVSRDALNKDIGILADAICQTYRTIEEYKADRYPSLRYDANRKIYPVIVTLENWYPLGLGVTAELDKQLKVKLAAANISENVLVEMPYSVASCDEIEELAQIVAQTGLAKFFDGKSAEKYRGWMIEGYIADAFKTERDATVDLFAETFDQILQPVRAVMPT